MQFTKLFNSILDSTIWQEPKETKIVWITMLAMADRGGEIHASIPGLAVRAGVSLDECQNALNCLKSPDKFSRTKDHDGRRIADIDGGWRLLNHGKYRALLSAEERKEYNRRKQAEYRSNRKTDVNDMSMTVNDNKQCQHSTEAEAEAELRTARAPLTELVPAPPAPPPANGAARAAIDFPDTYADRMPTEAARGMLEIEKRVQGLRDIWRSAMTYEEQQAIMANSRCLDSLQPEDWQNIRAYLMAKIPEGMPKWQPRSRLKFLQSVSDVHGYAIEWSRKNPTPDSKPRTGGWK
jgi:hypothetical protein